MPIPPRLRTLRALFEELKHANSVLLPEDQAKEPAFTTYSNAYEDLARLVTAINSENPGALPPITRIMYGEELSDWVARLHAAIFGDSPLSVYGEPVLVYAQPITIYGA